MESVATGQSETAIRRWWLIALLANVAYSVVWAFVSPMNFDGIAYRPLMRCYAMIGPVFFSGLAYLLGYRKSGVKLLWVMQVVIAISLLLAPFQWRLMADAGTRIGWLVSLIPLIFFALWNQRLIFLNRTIRSTKGHSKEAIIDSQSQNGEMKVGSRSDFIVNGHSGKKIERGWLICFWIAIAIRLLTGISMAMGPLPVEQDPIMYQVGAMMTSLMAVILFGSLFYFPGYRGGKTGILWFLQICLVFGLLYKFSSIQFGFPELLFWSFEVGLTVFSMVWNGRFISLNKAYATAKST